MFKQIDTKYFRDRDFDFLDREKITFNRKNIYISLREYYYYYKQRNIKENPIRYLFRNFLPLANTLDTHFNLFETSRLFKNVLRPVGRTRLYANSREIA